MKFLVIVLISIATGIQGYAQVKINNHKELLEYADRNSIPVRQAEIQPVIARQDVSIQASGLYPKIGAFATGDYYPIIATQVIPAEVIGGAPGTYLKAQFGLPYVFMTGVELSMPVINLEKWTQLSKARAQYRQASWSSKVAIENQHLQLLQAYYQVLVTREVARLNQDNVVVSIELSRVMEQRNKEGVINPSDLNRVRNLELDVQSAAVNYDRALEQGIDNLKTLLDLGVDDSLIIEDSLGQFAWSLFGDNKSTETRPAFHEAESRIEIAELGLKESRRGALPRLNLNGRYAYNMQTKGAGSDGNVEFDVSNIGLRLDVPLFQGNYYRSQRRKSELLLQSSILEKEKVGDQLTQQETNWITQYQAAWRKKSILDQKLLFASDNLRIGNLSMKEGIMEFDEYNNIFMEYNRVRMEYIQNLADGVLYYLLSTKNF